MNFFSLILFKYFKDNYKYIFKTIETLTIALKLSLYEMFSTEKASKNQNLLRKNAKRKTMTNENI